MTPRTRFLIIFLSLAFLMKVLGEVVHEVLGHGLFVLLFGGRILHVHIALLWPYELSYIRWSNHFAAWQLPWIHGGGILACYLLSFTLQGILLTKKVTDWRLASPLFWLAFWTWLSSTGYLITGGVRPFGDVAALIADGVLIPQTALLLGLVIFGLAFFALSTSLMDLLTTHGLVRSLHQLRMTLTLFWLIIPLVVALNALGRRDPLHYLQIFTALSCIPVLIAPITPQLLRYEPPQQGTPTTSKHPQPTAT